MVLLGRIELPTSALPRMRSTTELQQPTIPAARVIGPINVGAGPGSGALLAGGPRFVKQAFVRSDLHSDTCRGTKPAMSENPAQPSRQERLAAKLRENLRLRKAQARALASKDQGALPKAEPRS